MFTYRLAEIHRQQLSVDIREMQQRDIAERRYVVELGRGLRLARPRPQAGARRGGPGGGPGKIATPQKYWVTRGAGSGSSGARSLIWCSVSVAGKPRPGDWGERVFGL